MATGVRPGGVRSAGTGVDSASVPAENLVSYHLRLLRDGGMVTARRSSADGRDTYYHLDLGATRTLMADAGAALHPALAVDWRSLPPAAASRPRRPLRILFACTGNSGRSPMAAALVNDAAPGLVDAVSAGSHPKPINPLAVDAMDAVGLDLASHRPAALTDYRTRRFDWIVTLCDKVREVCPEFPGHPAVTHWSLPDPGAVTGSRSRRRGAYDETRRALSDRIEPFLTVALA